MTPAMNLTIKELRDEYLRIVESLPSLDYEGRRVAAHYMCHSEAVYKDEVADFLYIPKLYTERETNRFQEIATKTYTILEKVIKAYVDDPNYRRCFDFQQELEDLILIDPGYSCTIPVIRIDIFYDEDSGDFKFCEFNTDGSSAMNEDRETTNALALTPSFQAFSQQLEQDGISLSGFELFDSWVDTFLEIYADSPRAAISATPTIVISDFMDISTPIEI